jgi:hypothetical protein
MFASKAVWQSGLAAADAPQLRHTFLRLDRLLGHDVDEGLRITDEIPTIGCPRAIKSDQMNGRYFLRR